MSPSEYKALEPEARLIIKTFCRLIASYRKSARFHRIKHRPS